MTVEQNIRAFLLDPSRRSIITINGIEKAAKISGGNLAKFLAEKRNLPAKHVDKLVDVLKAIGFGIVPNSVPTPVPMASPWGSTLPLFNPDELREDTPKGLVNDEPELVASLVAAERIFQESIVPFTKGETVDVKPAILPAKVTGHRIAQLITNYKKRPMKTALFIQLRLVEPRNDQGVWEYRLQMVDADGNIYKGIDEEASPIFSESVFKNKAWGYKTEGFVHWYSKPVGNPVIDAKPKVKTKAPEAKSRTSYGRKLVDTLV